MPQTAPWLHRGIACRAGAGAKYALVNTPLSGAERIRSAILGARKPALLPFFTAGHPGKGAFHDVLAQARRQTATWWRSGFRSPIRWRTA